MDTTQTTPTEPTTTPKPRKSPPPLPVNADPIIRPSQLPALVGLSPATIWRLEKRGMFPARRRLSPGGQAVGYLLSEIQDWQRTRAAA